MKSTDSLVRIVCSISVVVIAVIFFAPVKTYAQKEPERLSDGFRNYTRIVISPDGSKIMAAEYSFVHLWDVATKSKTDLAYPSPPFSRQVGIKGRYIDFCSQGEKVIVEDQLKTYVLSLADGKVQFELNGRPEIIEQKNTGILIIRVAGEDKVCSILNASTGKEITRISTENSTRLCPQTAILR